MGAFFQANESIVGNLLYVGLFFAVVFGFVLLVIFGWRWIYAKVYEYFFGKPLDPDAAHVPEIEPPKKPEKAAQALAKTNTDWNVGGVELPGPHVVPRAGTGSGKTQGVSIPTAVNILKYRPHKHFFCMDPGAQIFEATAGIVERVLVYDFSGNLGVSSALNPFSTPMEARAFIRGCYPVEDAKEPYWNQRAGQLVFAVQEACAKEGRPGLLETFRALSNTQRLEYLATRSESLFNFWSGESEKGRQQHRSNALGPLEVLADPNIARVFAPGGYQPTFGRGRRDVAFFCPPFSAGQAEALGPLVSGCVDVIFDRMCGGIGGYMVLEEAASFMRVKQLPAYFATARGRGVRIMAVLQDQSQLEDKIGAPAARSITANADVQLFGATGDLETAKVLSGLSGDTRVGRAVSSWREVEGEVTEETSLNWEERARVKPQHVLDLRQYHWFTYVKSRGVWRMMAPPWWWMRDYVLSSEERRREITIDGQAKRESPPRPASVPGPAPAPSGSSSGPGRVGSGPGPAAEPPPPPRRGSPTVSEQPAATSAPPRAPEEPGSFCPNCGAKAGPGANFCRRCGTAIS